MAFNGYTAALSPTAIDTLSSSHVLSSSISSLSSSLSSSARPSPNHISKAYRQASTLFLTRRLPEALSTVLPLVSPPPTEESGGVIEPAPVARASRSTRIKVWSLYLTILNAILELEPEDGKDAFGTQEWRAICSKVREGEVWEEVVKNGYHGAEGEVDSDVVINLATLLLAHARTQMLNQKRLESYLAAAHTPNLDLSGRFSRSGSKTPRPYGHRSPARGTSGADTPRDLNARVKILELYTLHVLLRNNEWDYAREFISMSSVLDEERREAFLQALQSLQEDQEQAANKEREEKEQQEEQIRRDLEEARRLRAQNEERERRRLDEERSRREGSEVDYGIERTPSSRHRHTKNQSAAAAATRPLGSTSNKGKAVTPPTFGARATMLFSNLRALIEHWSGSLRTNPMLLMRTLAFLMGLLLMFSRKSVRERISRVLGVSWNKVKATAGMGVKVSYI